MNLLFVSIAFPPKNDPECLQTAKYFKYLVKQEGISIDVVSSKNPTLFMPTDEKLIHYTKGLRQLIEIKLIENKYLNYIIRSFFPTFQNPDSKFTFVRGFKKVIKELKKKPDAIYGRSFPMSSTKLAYKLAQHYKVPLILHMSDPWAYSPLHTYTPKIKALFEKEERKFITLANQVHFSSKKTKAYYSTIYQEFSYKFRLSPNVFDEDDIKENNYQLSDKLRFVYTGGLTGTRSPKPLLEAIKNVNEKHPSKLEKCEFIFAGQFDRKNTAYFNEYNIQNIKNLGLLPYPDALNLQREADILILIDTPVKDPKLGMFFPSKLLDYFIAKRKILAITNQDSATMDVLEKEQGETFLHEDVKGIQSFILKSVEAFEMKNMGYFNHRKINTTFSASENAKKLYDEIKKTINE